MFLLAQWEAATYQEYSLKSLEILTRYGSLIITSWWQVKWFACWIIHTNLFPHLILTYLQKRACPSNPDAPVISPIRWRLAVPVACFASSFLKACLGICCRIRWRAIIYSNEDKAHLIGSFMKAAFGFLWTQWKDLSPKCSMSECLIIFTSLWPPLECRLL